jgi:hypothetical protein
MLLIKCDTCERTFWVDGYTTPDGWMEPGEVVTELDSADELCNCLSDGASFSVLEEEHPTFGDEF